MGTMSFTSSVNAVTKKNDWSISPSGLTITNNLLTLKTANKYLDRNICISIPTGACTIGGGVSSVASNFSKTNLAVTIATGSDTNMANITVGSKDTTNYPYYFKVNGSTPAVTGNTSVSTTAITDAHTEGWIATKAATTVKNAQTTSPTVSVNAASGSGYVGLKKAAMTVSGTNTVTPTSSLSGSNVVLGTTNNGISVTGTGGGTASVTAKATTSTAGYAPASTDLGSATLTAASNTTTASKYIQQITIPSAKSLGTGNTSGTYGVIMSAGTADNDASLTKMYVNMGNNSVIYLTDSNTGKIWSIKTDSYADALSITQI